MFKIAIRCRQYVLRFMNSLLHGVYKNKTEHMTHTTEKNINDLVISIGY